MNALELVALVARQPRRCVRWVSINGVNEYYECAECVLSQAMNGDAFEIVQDHIFREAQIARAFDAAQYFDENPSIADCSCFMCQKPMEMSDPA